MGRSGNGKRSIKLGWPKVQCKINFSSRLKYKNATDGVRKWLLSDVLGACSSFEARCLFVVVFLHKVKQARFPCAVAIHKSLPHHGPRTDSPWKRQILKASSVSYFFPSSWVLQCVFFLWENTLKIYGSRQSYVCSGTSMTSCCVVSANILHIFVDLIYDARHFCTRINCPLDNSKHRSRAISRLSEGRKIHVLSCNIDYRNPLSPCSRSPRNT